MRIRLHYLILAGLAIGSCAKQKEEAIPRESPVIIFRSAEGRVLTTEDLKGVSGEVRYEILGTSKVSPEAAGLHQRAREKGGRGEYKEALEDLEQASRIAPEWPYPLYDMAYTYLLMKDFAHATTYYQKTVALAPRGFFTAITAANTLEREKRGEFPPGTYLTYLSLEWIGDPARKANMVRWLANKLPGFAPAWMEVANLAIPDSERLLAIEKGLTAGPDAETKGSLELNRALILDRQGDHAGAIRLLGELILDSTSTMATEERAKFTLSRIARK